MNEIDYLELQAIYLENIPYKPNLQLFKRELIDPEDKRNWDGSLRLIRSRQVKPIWRAAK